jgi:2-oxoglutarate ferredoxin oxidoreductase subunit beta
VLLMNHQDGIPLDPSIARLFPNTVEHDPHNLAEARALAERTDAYPIGLFYRDENALRYDHATSQGIHFPAAEKLKVIEKALERFVV